MQDLPRLVAAPIRWWATRPLLLRIAASVALAAGIWILSSGKAPELLGPPRPWFAWIHNSAHVVVFGALGALLFCCWPRNGAPWRGAAAAFVLTTLYGVVDEWHQSMVVHRESDVWDVVSDAGGALLGIGVIAWAHAGFRVASWLLGVGLVVSVVGVSVGTLS